MVDRGGRRGFPMGHPHLECTAKFYDECSRASINKDGTPKEWNSQPRRTVTWYPALVLSTGSILEIGCGCGHLAAMCDSFGIEYVMGVDFSRDSLCLARKAAPGHKFVRVDVRKDRMCSVLANRRFDTIVSLEVLEHVWDDLGFLARLPNGKVFVGSVPSNYARSHVRWFGDEDQVRERYGGVIDIDTVVVERGVNQRDHRYFVFRGVIVGGRDYE